MSAHFEHMTNTPTDPSPSTETPSPSSVASDAGLGARESLGARAPLIALENVWLTLPSRAGDVAILRDVSFTVHEPGSTAIVGQSGSGKTSLLMVIAGLEQATQGRVRIANNDFRSLNEDALAQFRGQTIGIVFQSFHLVPTMTALENVSLPLELSGAREANARARSMLEDVGLSHRADHYPAQLSGGEQQRVALARALAPAPRLLLADEPTGNLDTQTGQQIIDLIFQLQERHNTTLILVTHDTALATRCERCIRMQDGQLVDDKTGPG